MLAVVSSNIRSALRRTDALGQATRSMTILSKQSGEEYKKMNYSARMQKTGRPVSPHVTIYSFPIAALTSITNRVTGVTLSFGALGLAGAELVGGSGTALALMEGIGSSGIVLASTAKFAVAFPCVYHFFGAVRHLAWDKTPDMLTIADVEKSSYALVGSSLIVSGGFLFI